MGSVACGLVRLVGPDFSWLPDRWFKVTGGVMSFGLLGLTCALIIAAGVWALAARNGHCEWAARAKATIISVLVAVILLASASGVAGFLIGKFAHITP
ncbi:hypothetical protein HHJ73_10965 [Mobiluncus mulieris]|uniref:hypothetical protein n=1 Tax=Mobiluncus mulieris TaxID=2052 RepID=UPI00146FF030|nr:hypothetical protein [Mobiluncus mulieris]NMW82258.1 hypothetical protein [Mobiluncus mulieris]